MSHSNLVDDYILSMMISYPEQYPTRDRALDYLFCVIGTGLVWENGILVDDEHNHKRYHKDKARTLKEYAPETEYGRVLREWYDGDESRLLKMHEKAELLESYQREYNSIAEFLTQVELRVPRKTLIPVWHRWYGIHQSSPIANIPENAHPDYKMAAIETAFKAFLTPVPTEIDPIHGTSHMLPTLRTWLTKHMAAERILHANKGTAKTLMRKEGDIAARRRVIEAERQVLEQAMELKKQEVTAWAWS